MPHEPPHDPPVEGITDEPLVGVKLNESWMGHVMGLFSQAANQDYWASNQVEGEDKAIEILDLMAKGNAPVFDQLSARVQSSVAISVPHNTFTTLSFDTVRWNVGGVWNPATPDRLNLLQAGIWMVGGNVTFQANANGVRTIRMRENGPVFFYNKIQHSNTGITMSLSASTIWLIEDPNVLILQAHQTSGITLNALTLEVHSPVIFAHYLGPVVT